MSRRRSRLANFIESTPSDRSYICCESLDYPASYGDQLRTKEWFLKRREVFSRDAYFCVDCSIWLPKTVSHYRTKAKYTLSFENLLAFDEYVNISNGSMEVLAWKWITSEIRFIVDPSKLNLPGVRVSEGPVSLNAHHDYYFSYMEPWRYPNETLRTLCSKCHSAWHNSNKLVVYDSEFKYLMRLGVEIDCCKRCHGEGFIDYYSYHHDGICFLCKGVGIFIPKSSITSYARAFGNEERVTNV